MNKGLLANAISPRVYPMMCRAREHPFPGTFRPPAVNYVNGSGPIARFIEERAWPTMLRGLRVITMFLAGIAVLLL